MKLSVIIMLFLGITSVENCKAQVNAEQIKKGSLEIVSIWPEGTEGINPLIPESVKPQGKRFYNIYSPNLIIYKPESPNGLAIIICPGGGYRYVASGIEGGPVAKILNESGITVFVLKYRLPATTGANYKHPVPLTDALRAIQYVRYHAMNYGIDSNMIGIMGFSAGGHLAAMAGTLFDRYSTGSDDISKTSPRPDFMCLVYPLISTADSIAHSCVRTLVDSTNQNNPPNELSCEHNVTSETPTTYLAHAKDDKSVSYKNSLVMYDALKKYGVSVDIKLYDKGGHGFGVGREGTDSMNWLNDFKEWLVDQNYLDYK